MAQRIVIAGGGITGLSAAYYLHKKAQALGLAPEILVVERDDRLGGKTQTEVHGDVIMEAGPDSFLVSKPWFRQLCQELGLLLVDQNAAIKKTYILHKGQLVPLPPGMQLMIPLKLKSFVKTPLLSRRGKMRAMLEPLMPIDRTNDDESVGSFVRRRFGRELLENIAGPLMGGIYGGDYNEVSMKATWPQFFKMERERGSLMRAARKLAPARGTTGSAFQTVATGLHTVVDALVRAADGVRYLTGTGVTEVAPVERQYLVTLSDGEQVRADAVVLAVPAWASAGLLEPFVPEAAEELRTIPYNNSLVVALLYDRAAINHPLDATGFLVPKREPLELTASTWVSCKWAHMTPPDKLLIRGFLGRAGGKDWTRESDEAVVAEVRAGLQEIMGLTAEPLLTRVFRWPRAMAQYKVGHLDRVDRIDRLVTEGAPGLYLAGAAYRGVGLPDCVREGQTAAERVARHLGWESA